MCTHSFAATRFAMFNTLYVKPHSSNHCWSQCQNITGIHGYNTAHSLCSGGWFRAVSQPCVACGGTIVSQRLQSALQAGHGALMQIANAPVSLPRMGRGGSGITDLTESRGASKAIWPLKIIRRILRLALCTRVLKVKFGYHLALNMTSSIFPHSVHYHFVHLHGWKTCAQTVAHLLWQ